jgi:hypothetical protein
MIKIGLSNPLPSGEEETAPDQTQLNEKQLGKLPVESHRSSRPLRSSHYARFTPSDAFAASSSKTKRVKQHTVGKPTDYRHSQAGIPDEKVVETYQLSSHGKISPRKHAVIDAVKHHPLNIQQTEQRYKEKYERKEIDLDERDRLVMQAKTGRDALREISKKHVVRLVDESGDRVVAHHPNMRHWHALEHDKHDIVFQHITTGNTGLDAYRFSPTDRMKKHLKGEPLSPLTEKEMQQLKSNFIAKVEALKLNSKKREARSISPLPNTGRLKNGSSRTSKLNRQ